MAYEYPRGCANYCARKDWFPGNGALTKVPLTQGFRYARPVAGPVVSDRCDPTDAEPEGRPDRLSIWEMSAKNYALLKNYTKTVAAFNDPGNGRTIYAGDESKRIQRL